MFIIFVTLIAASLAAAAAHLYTALTLHAQTVTYALHTVACQQYLHGTLAYALAYLAQQKSLQIDHDKGLTIACDIFYTKQDGYIQGAITYTKSSQGYGIKVILARAGQHIAGLTATVLAQAGAEKVTYCCVAIDTF